MVSTYVPWVIVPTLLWEQSGQNPNLLLFYNWLHSLTESPLDSTLTTAPTDREHLMGSVRFQVVRASMSTRINKATMPISWMSRMI